MAVNILQIHWSNRNFQITGGDCDALVNIALLFGNKQT